MTRDLGRGTRGLVRALLPDATPARSEAGRMQQLASVPIDHHAAWLISAVLTRSLPLPHDVDTVVRSARHDGVLPTLRRLRSEGRRNPWRGPRPTVLADTVVIDAHHSVTTGLATGIQRVARAVIADWEARGDVEVLAWSPSFRQLRLTRRTARGHRLTRRAVVPVSGSYLLSEFASEPARAIRIQALAEHSRVYSAVIGYDVIPLTTAETTGPKMPGLFAKSLAATSRMDLVATISDTAGDGYRGWRRMLGAAGLTGPEIRTVALPVAPLPVTDADRAAAEQLFTPDDLPLVLCVGSHEPRKNHVAVLQAAELLWRRGDRFRLMFIGGNSWNTGTFWADLDRLRAEGRPVSAPAGVSDGLLAWGYRLARFTVFPSLDEGFGLPVAESLAVGTPVVTSDYGSMAEIASAGGAIMVDPRDDLAIAEAMHTLLADDAAYQSLRASARVEGDRDWADYASELWQAIVK